MKWSDVDWERRRLRIPSPKTEHHDGGNARWIPLFPEIAPHLERVFDEAAPGTEWIITRYRDKNANLRTQLKRIIRKAGLEPWPKLFHNLRVTRQTELAQTWPLHIVCEWIGNSRAVAAKHYLQVTDEDFARALATPTPPSNSAVQNPVQSLHAENAKRIASNSQSLETACFAGSFNQLVPPDGLEPSTL